MDKELKIKVAKYPKMYDRMVAFDMVPEREQRHTLKDLLDEHRKRGGVAPESKEAWDKVSKNLVDFFGENQPMDTITQEQAVRFEEWLRTVPLNTRAEALRSIDRS